MNVKKIIEVCNTRQLNGVGCNGCSYKGKTCDHAKDILKVERPSEYNTNNNMLNKEEN